MKHYLLLLVGLVMALGACNREKTPEPVCAKDTVYLPERHSWTAHPAFKLEFKCMYNSLATDDSLFLYGPGALAQLDTNHKVRTLSANWFESFIRQPLNQDFVVEVDKVHNVILLRVKKVPTLDGTQLLLHFPALDSSFQRLGMNWMHNLHQVAAINDRNQLLVPVYTRTARYGMPTLYLIGVKLTYYGSEIGRIATTSFQKIILQGTGSLNGEVYNMQTYRGKFFVGCDESTMLIRPDGTYKKVLNANIGEKLFSHNNSLYAITRHQVYRSDDEGENWVLAYTLDAPAIGRIFNVGDQACLVLNDKIALLELNAESITSRELVNDGLAGNQITSVCRFRDRVYVTTLSGVFYKSYQDFLTFKPEPR